MRLLPPPAAATIWRGRWTLTAAKAVTIPKLLELLPPGTPDPSYLLYDTTMYSLSGVVGMAFVANALVRPVDPKYFTGGGGGAK